MLCPQGLYREEFEEHKKAKGVLRNKRKNDTHFEKYVRTLTENKKTTTFNAIRSKNHQSYSISQTKIALTSFFGNKRYWTDAIHSVHYGHFSISN